MAVQVFFGEADSRDCTDVRPVERRVPATEAVATAALRELFAGTTEQERATGLVGYGPDTDGLLRTVRVVDGTAYVDLDAARFPERFGTSCGGTFFLVTVRATLTQFPSVSEVVLALDGDPAAFVRALEGECPADPPQAPDPCDPAPFGPGG
jgi:spore germination protein GerM